MARYNTLNKPPTRSNQKHIDALSKLLDAETAKAIISRFDPSRVTPFPTALGGMYTKPVLTSNRLAVHNLLDTIYPRISAHTGKIWHSTNFETHCIGVGAPRTTPFQDKEKFTRVWLEEREAEQRKAVSQRINERNIAVRAGNLAPAAATNWLAFATQSFNEHQAKRTTYNATPEGRAKRLADMVELEAKALANPPLVEETYRPHRVGRPNQALKVAVTSTPSTSGTKTTAAKRSRIATEPSTKHQAKTTTYVATLESRAKWLAEMIELEVKAVANAPIIEDTSQPHRVAYSKAAPKVDGTSHPRTSIPPHVKKRLEQERIEEERLKEKVVSMEEVHGEEADGEKEVVGEQEHDEKDVGE